MQRTIALLGCATRKWMNVEMRRFGCRHELKVRETRTRTWHRPAPQRHTVWPPKRAVASLAIGCCRGAPIASGSVPPASCDSDGCCVVTIRDGRIHGDGPTEQALTASALGSIFGVPVEVLERDGYFTAKIGRAACRGRV